MPAVALVIGAGDATGGAVAHRFARGGYDHIAESYWMLHRQPRDAWTHELDLRPWIEKF